MSGARRALVRLRWGRIILSTAAATVVIVAMLGGAGAFSGPSAALASDTTSLAPQSSPRPPVATPSPSAVAPASPSVESPAPLPAGSGTGRRAVFSQSEQRVWIVEADGTIARTYLVSGSTEDNLLPGTYSVYSRSRWAVGVDDSGAMQYFVRFTHGTDTGAAIGFHSIPTKDGRPVETVAELGEPRSHGCIRQRRTDAIAMWNFAHLGTKVVVVA